MRGSRTVAIMALGLLGGLFLVATELTTVASVEIPGRTCREVVDVRAVDRCELSGMERHGGALLLLGVVAGLMAIGAGRGQSTPAAVALIAIGVIALALTIVGDLPETNEVGAVGVTYEGATGKRGPGLYLEGAGGALLAAAGALGLSTRRKAFRPADDDRR